MIRWNVTKYYISARSPKSYWVINQGVEKHLDILKMGVEFKEEEKRTGTFQKYLLVKEYGGNAQELRHIL